jgi:PHD/YefM family antitoxin component YafN of YafNO toxin-antitoxin module
MSGGCFNTLTISQFIHAVEELHGRVASGHGRVVITRDGCDDVCVLISKAELESLEQALEILSSTPDFQAMCKTLAMVAASAAHEPVIETA